MANLLANILKEKPSSQSISNLASEVKFVKLKDNPIINFAKQRRLDGEWSYPEYDFAEIDRITDIESLVQQSFRKKLILMTKEGFQIKGENPQLVNYVNVRLRQICNASSTTLHEFISDLCFSLIKYSNCWIAVVRDKNKSGGFPYTINNKKIDPIAGLFFIPPSTIQFKTNEKNQPIGYRQILYQHNYRRKGIYKKEYADKNMLHFFTNKKDGIITGTPRLIPVIEDIKSLRRIEENTEILINSSAFPIIHYKVGTPDMPAIENPNGVSEIDEVTMQLRNMPPEGMIVTSERHEMKMMGNEGRALRLESYLSYFKKRVLNGLSISAMDIGEGDGATKASAETMSRSLLDEIKADQKAIEAMFKRLIIDPLLMEASVKLNLNEDKNQVFLKFNDVDTVVYQKMQNHYLQLYLQNMITHQEARRLLGFNPLDQGDVDNLNISINGRINAEIASKNMELASSLKANENSQKESNRNEGKGKGNNSSKGTVINTASPRNQHGERGAPRITMTDNIIDQELQTLIADLKTTELEPIGIVKFYENYFRDRQSNNSKAAFDSGLVDSGVLAINEAFTESAILSERDKLTAGSNFFVHKLFKDIKELYLLDNNKENLIKNIEELSYRYKLIEDTETMKAYNWGFLNGLKYQGLSKVRFDIEHTKTNYESIVDKDYNISDFNLKTIPPWHPNSKLKFKRSPYE